MGFQNSGVGWSAFQVSRMIDNGSIVFTNPVQRGSVWNIYQKSCLIRSMLKGIPIPAVYAKKFTGSDDVTSKAHNVYDILDGIQRLSTIGSFMHNEFRLMKNLPPVPLDYTDVASNDVIDVSQMYFKDFPETLQENLKAVSIKVFYFENLTKEDERELFSYYNNGTAMSTKSKLVAECVDLDTILEIGSHPLFSSILSKKALSNKYQVSLILKMWCILFSDLSTVDFSLASLREVANNLVPTAEECDSLCTIFNLIHDTRTVLIDSNEKDIAKILSVDTHLVSLTPFFREGVNRSYNEDQMKDWLLSFFKTNNDNTSNSEAYNNALLSGPTKNANICIRNEELSKSFYGYFDNNN